MVADDQGHIGFQQSGSYAEKTPKIPQLPRIGWKSEESWNGIGSHDKLATLYDPPAGVIATANSNFYNIPHCDNQDFMNELTPICMSEARKDRIYEMLSKKEKIGILSRLLFFFIGSKVLMI